MFFALNAFMFCAILGEAVLSVLSLSVWTVTTHLHREDVSCPQFALFALYVVTTRAFVGMATTVMCVLFASRIWMLIQTLAQLVVNCEPM